MFGEGSRPFGEVSANIRRVFASAGGGPMWPAIDGHGSIALGRRLRPCARKIEQGSFLFFGFGFGGPTEGLFGVVTELIGF
jgi:hypothetical protein